MIRPSDDPKPARAARALAHRAHFAARRRQLRADLLLHAIGCLAFSLLVLLLYRAFLHHLP
ncbi:MAG: hypothetical protein ACHREM_06550 [Polyangiales bacterium]